MEASQPLSIESFSYRWLVNIRSSFESRGHSLRTSLDASDEASFIEMDPTMPPSKRFFSRSQDFKFDTVPLSPSSSLALAHADQLISNGYLMPLKTMQSYETAGAVSDSSPITDPTGKSSAESSSCSFRKSCRRLSRQIFQKYLNFLRPLCRRIQGVGANGKAEKFHGGSHHPTRDEAQQSCDEWRRSCDSESSIYEAVLHCKRSIGK